MIKFIIKSFVILSLNILSIFLINGKLDCRLYNANFPKILNNNSNYNISGRFYCSNIIKKLVISVIDRDQFDCLNMITKKINSKSINLQDYSYKIHFNKILPGEKLLKITFIDTHNNIYYFSRNYTVLGRAKEPIHMTNYCKIEVKESNFDINNIINSSENNNNTFYNGTINIRIPKSKKIDGILIKFYQENNNYTVLSYSKDRKLINYFNNSEYPMLHKYFKLSEETSDIKIIIRGNKKQKGICLLRIYEKNKVGFSVEQWKPPEKSDLMVVSSHRDDELLYFGGTIPYYSFIKKKKICTVFMSGNDIIRLREALSSQWSMGIKNYPIFMGFEGGNHLNINRTLNIWGGEEFVIGKMVEKIRQYKPGVIVTHDLKGEYGHPSHRTTTLVVRKAILFAANPNKFKYSYNIYGTHEAKKLYIHLYKRNQVIMNWHKRSYLINYKTPFELACIGYDKYYSQHKRFGMTFKKVKKYPNYLYGLIYTKVGKDIEKNDFFENIN